MKINGKRKRLLAGFCFVVLGAIFLASMVYADFVNPDQGQKPPSGSQVVTTGQPQTGYGLIDPTAQNIFYNPYAFQSQQMTPMAMAYKVLLRDANDPCGIREVVPTQYVFRTNDRIRFKFQANCDGYLYIFQRGSDGSTNRLFPHPMFSNNQNRVYAYREYVIPVRGWFKFDATPGVETVYFFLSKNRIKEFDVAQVASHTPVAVPMNQQSWAVVTGFFNRAKRDLILETDPGQSGINVYATPITYVAQIVVVQQPMISAVVELRHRP